MARTTKQSATAAGAAGWDYAKNYYKNPEVMKSFELLARYRPEVAEGYFTLRQAAFNTGPGAALDEKTKELVIIAIEIARTKTNPPPVGHARRAIEAGATPAEIAEVASLCILIGGMLTYQESGKHALEAAEELYAAKTKVSGAVPPRPSGRSSRRAAKGRGR